MRTGLCCSEYTVQPGNSAQELEEYLWKLEEAKKRDHRKLGKELGLFYFSEDVGPGLPLFTPKGEMLRYLMESYVRDVQTRLVTSMSGRVISSKRTCTGAQVIMKIIKSPCSRRWWMAISPFG
jgi:hypothetical protein